MRLRISAFLGECVVFYNLFFHLYTEALYGENVNPVEANSTRFPYVVGIVKLKDIPLNIQRDYECVGTLISIQDVLTSEHCFYGAIVEGIKILVGSIKLSQATQFSPEWWISYNKWAVVNGIDTEHYDNDIVVIRLLEEVRSETNARIAMLSYSFLPLRGTNVEIVGWGILNNGNMSDVLQIAATEILANDACGDRVTALDGDRIIFDSRYICTYTEPCILLQFGDSGGPLIHNNEVVGINIGTCPVLDVVIHPAKVNIHLATRYYKRFIQDIVYEYL